MKLKLFKQSRPWIQKLPNTKLEWGGAGELYNFKLGSEIKQVATAQFSHPVKTILIIISLVSSVLRQYRQYSEVFTTTWKTKRQMEKRKKIFIKQFLLLDSIWMVRLLGTHGNKGWHFRSGFFSEIISYKLSTRSVLLYYYFWQERFQQASCARCLKFIYY